MVVSMYSNGICNVKLPTEDTLSGVNLCHSLITQFIGFKLMMLGCLVPQRTTCCMLYAYTTGPHCNMQYAISACCNMPWHACCNKMLVEDDARGQHSASHRYGHTNASHQHKVASSHARYLKHKCHCPVNCILANIIAKTSTKYKSLNSNAHS